MRTVILIIGMSCAVVQVRGECLPVSGDRILGRDLVAAVPQLAGLPADAVIAYTPAPGTGRSFTGVDLARIAVANGIPAGTFPDACFQIPLRDLSSVEVEAAMRRSLPEGAEIQMVERSSGSVPDGAVVFPLGSLEPPSGIGIGRLWRGYVQYAATRRVAVWAKVNVTFRARLVIPVRDLAVGVAVGGDDVQVAQWKGPVLRDQFAVRMDEVLGKVPKRPVKAGTPVPIAWLEEAKTVRRGESVMVEVVCGSAKLLLSAVAERDGRTGDTLEFRNPTSGRTFRAHVQGSRAVLVLGSGDSL
jgi:flagella basal body P-ring formation protein FlgA